MPKVNCWEFKSCGREPGGQHVAELGACPAATSTLLDGVNEGKNGGRSCWALVGTFCGGRVQGLFAAKMASCLVCEFFKRVALEEGPRYAGTPAILTRLH